MPRLEYIAYPAVSPGPLPALPLIGMVLGIAREAFGTYKQVPQKTDWRLAT
jgi:hypothetical protein